MQICITINIYRLSHLGEPFHIPFTQLLHALNIVDSVYLGMTRLTEARFENPDESDIVIGTAIAGMRQKPMSGF